MTRALESLSAGDGAAVERLLPLVYGELRSLAAGLFRRESPGHTLQPTALVHEAYVKLVEQDGARWSGRAHFFAVGAMVMRRILVDHARSRGAEKRGGGAPLMALTDELGLAADAPLDDVLDVDRLLETLGKLDPRQARIVELRVFAGMSVAEVAEALGVSARTVNGDWSMARAWLRRELRRTPERS